MTTLSQAGSAPTVRDDVRFYGVDAARVSLQEYMWEAKNPVQLLLIVPIAIIVKLFRIRIPNSTDDIPVESLRPFRVASDEFPMEIWEKMALQLAELHSLRFEEAACHVVRDPLNVTDSYLVTMCGPSNVVARIHLRSSNRFHPPREKLYIEFLTRFKDDRYVWSTSGRADMKAPLTCEVVRKVNATAAELFQLHQERVIAQGRIAMPVRTAEEAGAISEWQHDVVRAFHVGRKVFRALPAAEQQQLTITAGTLATTGVDASPHQAVLNEIRKIQESKAGWRRSLMLLVISIVAFIAIGIGGWNKADFLYLIPILFFHELGHYLTMRAFGYRNLRMFFIPFFGAAVTGHHYNIAGWKKGVVALMGPVPGIALGVLLGIAGVVLHHTLLLHISVLLLIVNASNLLPVLPLDGGHVFQTVLFSRHYALDIGFRIVAILCLAALAMIPGAKVMLYIAISLGVGIPLALRLGRATHELRREGISDASLDSQTVPTAVAERIIDKLSAGSKKPIGTRIMARQVLTVFEGLNARPPGWVGSILLVGTQAGAMFASVLCLVLFLVASNPNVRNFFRQAANQPAHLVTNITPIEKPGPAYHFATPSEERTVVATFKTEALATSGLDALMPTLPPDASATQLSETLFITFPASRKQDADAAFDDLSTRTKECFVQNKSQMTRVRLLALCRSTAQADAARAELNDYFVASHAAPRAIPPWEATRWQSAADYQRQRLARATLRRLRDDVEKLYLDPSLSALVTKRGQARLRSDQEAVDRLDAEEKETRRALVKSRLAALQALPASEVDHDFLAALPMETLTDVGGLYKRLPDAAAAHLGLMPAAADGAAEGAETAQLGSASGEGLFINVYAHFPAAEHGLPAICRWLREQGCRTERYELYASPSFDEMDD